DVAMHQRNGHHRTSFACSDEDGGRGARTPPPLGETSDEVGPSTRRVNNAPPATAAGIVTIAPRGTRKHTNTAAPNPTANGPVTRSTPRRSANRSPRRSNRALTTSLATNHP